MNDLKSWIINICTAVFFITAVEMILPDNKMKKYAKFVLGLILITVIINPLVKYINNGMDISTFMNNTNSYVDKYLNENETDKYREKSMNDTLNVFKTNLETTCEKKLKEKFAKGYYKVKADVSYDNTKGQFEVKGLLVSVSSNAVEKVKKVDIKANSSYTAAAQDTSELGNSIKSYISEEFELSKELITVYKTGT